MTKPLADAVDRVTKYLAHSITCDIVGVAWPGYTTSTDLCTCGMFEARKNLIDEIEKLTAKESR